MMLEKSLSFLCAHKNQCKKKVQLLILGIAHFSASKAGGKLDNFPHAAVEKRRRKCEKWKIINYSFVYVHSEELNYCQPRPWQIA